MTNTPETLNILTPDFRMPEHCGGDRWSILHGDSLQILRQFVPNSFDAIITDPPYASGGSSQTTKNRSTNEKYSSMSKEKALPDFDSDQMDQLSGCSGRRHGCRMPAALPSPVRPSACSSIGGSCPP